MIGGGRDIAKPLMGFASEAQGARRARVTVSRWAAAEAGRLYLLVPLMMIVGIVTYFSLPTEPWRWLGLTASAIFLLLVAIAISRRWERARLLALAALSFSVGLALIQWRTAEVEAPILTRPLGPLSIEGKLVAVEEREGDQRFTIIPTRMEAVPKEDFPAQIRVSWRGARASVAPGAYVRFFGQLTPPPGPAIAGGFDYGRALYYDRIGAVGFSYTAPEMVGGDDTPSTENALRAWLSERIKRHVASEEAAAVATALVTGQRGGIPQEITDQLRDTGLAHLLAISGLHMGLVCGLVFGALRGGLIFWPRAALALPVRKIAAIGALIAGAAYLGLSGGSISAQRAFIMTGIAFAAIMADRRAFSLRNVAFAAVAVMFLQPEAVMSAGFQMSFAAVTALIASYDAWEKYGAPRSPLKAWPKHVRVPVGFLAALFATSLIAGLATGPFAIFHFNRMANFGLLANMLVMPLFTLAVMPGLILSVLLMPIGAEGPVLAVVGKALEAMFAITEAIAAWPGAATTVAQWPVVTFLGVLAGGGMLCLLTTPLRLFGLPVMLLSLLAAPLLADRPTVFVTDDARNVGVVGADGALHIVSRRRSRFEVARWAELHGIDMPLRDLPKFEGCGEGACSTISRDGLVVTYTEDLASAARACRSADIVIIPRFGLETLARSCSATLISAERAGALGATSYRRAGTMVQQRAVATVRGHRPWSVGSLKFPGDT